MFAATQTIRRRPRPALAGALVLVLALAACSSSASSPAESATAGDVISLAGSAFAPESITIQAGDSVVFNNDDARSHRIAEGEEGIQVDDPAFEAVSLSAGSQSGPITFDEPGTYNLTCTIHPSMNMTVIVE